MSYPNTQRITTLQDELSAAQDELLNLQSQINNLQSSTGLDYQNVTQALASVEVQFSSIQEQINALENQVNSGMEDSSSLQASISSLQNQLTALQNQVANLQTTTQNNYTYLLGQNFSLSQLFDTVKGSVVIIEGLVRNVDFLGRVFYTQVQGSGFIYHYNGSNLILTNNHVINGVINITVTFIDGKGYSATVRGSSSQTDFAVLTLNTTQISYQPLQITSSSTLKVGDPVIAVGAPYGLEGSMTDGIISALNRTLETDTGATLTGVIQTTAPLNPGNSGGPLMNYNGQVVGITTAIVSDSQGIGFAIPSNTILTEVQRIMSS
jgi:S1-C subfamily serine protease